MWWESLNMLQKIFFCIGLGASVIMLLQIVLMLFGVGDNEADVDLTGDGDADVSIDVSDGFALFSIRGIVAFFAIGGWVGYLFAENTVLSIIASVISGTIALVAMAFIMRGMMKLRSEGNVNKNKAIGKIADVYLTIPPKDKGFGKINMLLEERFVEFDASQEGDEPITTGSKVKVIALSGDTLVVEKL